MPQVLDSQETRQRRSWTLKIQNIVCQFARAPDDQHIRRERPHNSCTIGPARVELYDRSSAQASGPFRQIGEERDGMRKRRRRSRKDKRKKNHWEEKKEGNKDK